MALYSSRWLRACAPIGFVMALGAAPALAADVPEADAAADAAQPEMLADIVVTAQKRATNLQKTPIAISVLDDSALRNRHVQSLVDLQDGGVPSLRVAPFYSRNSALIVNVRGVGVLADSNQPARDQGVGVYIDGVYLGRAQGLGTALYDVQSIEVLKGPQGTLFGRNTEGGAISIVTRKPTGEFHFNGTAGIGDYGSYKGEAHIDLPAIANIAVKLDGIVTSRDGLVKNPMSGERDFNAFNRRGLHAEALWKPAPGFNADYAFDTSYDASTPLYLQSVTAGTLLRAPAQPIEPERVGTANVGVPQQPSVGKTHGHRLTLDWQASPGLELKSISAYRELSQTQFDNGSANTSVYKPGVDFARYSLARFDAHQFSQEVQAIGELPRLHYLAGALYFRERVEDNAQAFNTMRWNTDGTAATVIPLVIAKQKIDRASHVTTSSIGAFGQATYTPAVAGDMFHLTGGLRWTRDQKEGSLFIVNDKTPSVNGVVAPRDLDAGWSRVDPMVTLAADLGDDVHVYGKWSTGYKSGGANSRSLTYAPFNPESVSMFEIGAKSEFWDKHARLNVAAYTGDYQDIQIDFSANYVQRNEKNEVLSTTRTTTETANAPGDGRLKGVEADLTLLPVRGLTLTASYAYTDVRIPATVNPFPQPNGTIATTPIKIYAVYTPRHAASGAIDYEVPLADSMFRLHLDGNYDSGFYANYNDPQTGLAQPKGDSAFIVNGRVALADIALNGGGATLGVSVWTRNLFNEQHLFYKALSPLIGTYGFFNERRTFGGEVNIRF
jgi:iron complex outermembrane receptor protein